MDNVLVGTGTIGLVLTSVLQILDAPGGGLFAGVTISATIFYVLLRTVCDNCKSVKSGKI